MEIGSKVIRLLFVVRTVLAFGLLSIAISSMAPQSRGTSVATFSSTNTAINDAFASVYSADQNGGDVSELVQRLNEAVMLAQRAEAENSTDSVAAAADLENATQIAENVSQQAASVSASGVHAHEARLYESAGIIISSIIASSIIYREWDPVHRRVWLFARRKHVVTRTDEKSD